MALKTKAWAVVGTAHGGAVASTLSRALKGGVPDGWMRFALATDQIYKWVPRGPIRIVGRRVSKPTLPILPALPRHADYTSKWIVSGLTTRLEQATEPMQERFGYRQSVGVWPTWQLAGHLFLHLHD